MKGKLHKMVSGYILSLNGDIDDTYAIVNEELAKDYEWYKLSLKNCQAIERGYDLDELGDEYYKQFDNLPVIRYNAYTAGFQKALEILGDKKFSEKDMSRMMLATSEWLNSEIEYGADELIKKVIQSLQQTEWDVEIIEECLDKDCDGVDRKGDCITTGKPKLDTDGCLILKKL